MKIILPISLGTFLLDYSGWIHHLDGVLEPLMGVIHLPALAALPLLVGLLTGIYGAIATMSVLPFTVPQLTLMAVFLLIAHSLIQEGMVQSQSGCPAWLATLFRLVAAVATVVVLGWFMDSDTALNPTLTAAATSKGPFPTAIFHWAVEMAILSVKILVIITSLMILMELLKAYALIDIMIRCIGPFMGMLGLKREVGMLWITAAVFGITYGGAVIVEESREKKLRWEELGPLHISIGINHAMVEDPALFLPFGIHPIVLWIPRLIAAILFTAMYRLWLWMVHRHRTISATTPSDGM